MNKNHAAPHYPVLITLLSVTASKKHVTLNVVLLTTKTKRNQNAGHSLNVRRSGQFPQPQISRAKVSESFDGRPVYALCFNLYPANVENMVS
jgi:hypothetical protein